MTHPFIKNSMTESLKILQGYLNPYLSFYWINPNTWLVEEIIKAVANKTIVDPASLLAALRTIPVNDINDLLPDYIDDIQDYCLSALENEKELLYKLVQANYIDTMTPDLKRILDLVKLMKPESQVSFFRMKRQLPGYLNILDFIIRYEPRPSKHPVRLEQLALLLTGIAEIPTQSSIIHSKTTLYHLLSPSEGEPPFSILSYAIANNSPSVPLLLDALDRLEPSERGDILKIEDEKEKNCLSYALLKQHDCIPRLIQYISQLAYADQVQIYYYAIQDSQQFSETQSGFFRREAAEIYTTLFDRLISLFDRLDNRVWMSALFFKYDTHTRSQPLIWSIFANSRHVAPGKRTELFNKIAGLPPELKFSFFSTLDYQGYSILANMARNCLCESAETNAFADLLAILADLEPQQKLDLCSMSDNVAGNNLLMSSLSVNGNLSMLLGWLGDIDDPTLSTLICHRNNARFNALNLAKNYDIAIMIPLLRRLSSQARRMALLVTPANSLPILARMLDCPADLAKLIIKLVVEQQDAEFACLLISAIDADGMNVLMRAVSGARNLVLLIDMIKDFPLEERQLLLPQINLEGDNILLHALQCKSPYLGRIMDLIDTLPPEDVEEIYIYSNEHAGENVLTQAAEYSKPVFALCFDKIAAFSPPAIAKLLGKTRQDYGNTANFIIHFFPEYTSVILDLIKKTDLGEQARILSHVGQTGLNLLGYVVECQPGLIDKTHELINGLAAVPKALILDQVATARPSVSFFLSGRYSTNYGHLYEHLTPDNAGSGFTATATALSRPAST